MSAWDDIGGILMGILTIVLLARIVANLAAVNLPIPVSFAMTSAVLAFLIFALALIKNLTDDYSTWASYVGVVLAALIAVGAWMEIQAAGGVESLKSEASSFGGSGAATTAAAGGAALGDRLQPPPAPPAPPAPAAPGSRECDGCGLGRTERRAVDRAGHLTALSSDSPRRDTRAAANPCV